MGALGVNGSRRNAETDDAEPVETEETAAPAAAEGADPSFVSNEQLKPESRRERAERLANERLEAQLKPMRDQFSQREQAHEQLMQQEREFRRQQAEELARLRGTIEALQRQPQQTQPQQQQAPVADPQNLMREAKASLAAGNLDEYHEKLAAAQEAVAEARADARIKTAQEEMQKRIPQPAPQLPWHVQVLMTQLPEVMAAGEKGIRAVIRAEEDLGDDGIPPGPERSKLAFQRASEKFRKKAPASTPSRPQFDQSSREAVAGIPTQRGGGSAGGDHEGGVKLNEAQMAAMKAGGFKSAEEYLKWGDPRRYGLAK